MKATTLTNKTRSTIAAGSISTALIAILSWALPQAKVNIPGEVIAAIVMLATTGLAAYQTKEDAGNFDLDDLREYVRQADQLGKSEFHQGGDAIERG